jgi:hypothetical protein
MLRQHERSGAYERHPVQYQPSAGYEPQGQYEAPQRYEEPLQYDQFQRDDQYQHGAGGPASQSGPAGRAGQYGRPDYDLPQRDEHYASFAVQDAAYTRPRPAGARAHFGPQDDTDPLNVVPLNIGNYS